MFILPKKVLHEISRICQAFLWSGQYFTHKSSFVTWERLCAPKNVGGLRFRNVVAWNIANLGKYVWVIQPNKTESS